MAKAFKPLYEGMTDPVCVDIVKVVGAEFPMVLFALEQVVGDHQQLVGNGDDCPFGSAAGGHASIECRQALARSRRNWAIPTS